MLRSSAVALSLVVGIVLSACSGDDTVNPTNPDASSAAKPGDAGGDGSKDGGAGDASKGDAATDAHTDGKTDAPDAQEEGGDT